MTSRAGYRAWQTGFPRQVAKGERGIRVLAPVTKRVDKLDAHGQPVLGADGKPVKAPRSWPRSSCRCSM